MILTSMDAALRRSEAYSHVPSGYRCRLVATCLWREGARPDEPDGVHLEENLARTMKEPRRVQSRSDQQNRPFTFRFRTSQGLFINATPLLAQLKEYASPMKGGLVDMHVHPPTKEFLLDSGGPQVAAAARKFGHDIKLKTIEDMLEEYSNCGVEKLVLFAWDAETASHRPRVTNEFVAKLSEEFPQQILGFASVDPHKKSAVKDLDNAVRELKLRGLKLHPQAQAFEPNDHAYYPIYSKCVELKIPVTFHTGSTYWGAGLAGGGGLKLRYSDPMLLDDVAADFPELNIVMAHPGWPWQDEQLAIAMHKENAYVDLSGWSPKYFQPLLVTYMSKLIPQKFLFGTDYPMLTPSRWLHDFDELPLNPEVKRMVLSENARKLLGI